MGLIEDNEINNNTLAGVWITTGNNPLAYPGHVTTITSKCRGFTHVRDTNI